MENKILKPNFLEDKSYELYSKYDNKNILSPFVTFFDSDNKNCELTIDFSDEFLTEKTIFDFIMMLGFDIGLAGSSYIIEGLTDVINSMILPTTINDFYEIISKKKGISSQGVCKAITLAINSIDKIKFERINHIFGYSISEQVKGRPRQFILMLCSKFIMHKSHAMGQRFLE